MSKEKKHSEREENFVAVRKNSDGTLKEFKAESGKVYDYEMAIEAIEKGKIANAMLFTGRDGKQHIRSKSVDGQKNFKDLKEF